MALSMTEHQKRCFWSKVQITDSARDCWEWLGARKPSSYGNVRINKRYLLAHRVAFELANTEIPDGLIVCHVCDNPACCNPSHLMLGTVKSNSVDMLIKGRQRTPDSAARGSATGMAKLHEDQVVQIREKYTRGELNQYQLADLYGVSQAAIGAILLRKTWRHI